MEVDIRAAIPADLDRILKLWQVAAAEPTHTDDLTSLDQLITFDPSALLVAETDGELVGSVIAGWDGWRGSIYRLAVVPEYRRRGLARDLMDAAVTRLREAGAVRLQAIVAEDDERATGFWGASGWERQVARARFVNG
ncbi:MAG TPA: GNAT family N-acetyltransferase [Acidimicrobiales bacterium]